MSPDPVKRPKIVIRPDLSAIAPKNNKPSRAISAAIACLKKHDAERICEVGCGLLANTQHILKAFPHVILTDRKEIVPRIEDKLSDLQAKFPSYKGFVDHTQMVSQIKNVDAAIVINVLHILPTPRQRLDLLKSIYRILQTNGLVFVDVPRNESFYRNDVKTAIPYSDGYCMHRGTSFTFYKNMDSKEISDLVEHAGFSADSQIFLDHRITFLARKLT
jgi:SAM-dependent methyltransferase